MSPSETIRAVLFDLDGTLLDSFPGHFAAYRYMFSRFGIEIDEQTFLDTYTPNWYQTFEKIGLPYEQWEQANAYWMEEAARHAPALFPGAVEMLAALAQRYRLGIVTSGSKSRIQREIDEVGIRRYFEVIVSGDDVTRRKPDPQGLEMALQALEVGAAQAVYVGDANADREMAEAAGVRFIGVPSRFDALGAGCTRLSTIGELVDVLRQP